MQSDIFRLLCIRAGQSFNALRLAKLAGVSQTAIAKALPVLVKAGLITQHQDKESGRYAIALNRESQLVLQLKRAENLKQIYACGLAAYLQDALPGALVIVFGSFARGDDTTESDIDLAIIGLKERRLDLGDFEKALERQIIPNFYSSFTSLDRHLKNNILNGIVLHGSVDL